jgi:predicted nucleic acid-binding protein
VTTHLLDTTILVDLLRKNKAAEGWFTSIGGAAAMSVVSLTELYAGVRSRREEQDLLQLETVIRPLIVDRDVAIRAGVFVRLYEASHNIDDPDALIAATAEHHGLKLATLNVKHFPMFRKLKPAY